MVSCATQTTGCVFSRKCFEVIVKNEILRLFSEFSEKFVSHNLARAYPLERLHVHHPREQVNKERIGCPNLVREVVRSF